MKHQNFLQYDWWKPKRFVWDAASPPEATPPPEATSPPEATPPVTPEAPVAASEAAKAAAEKVVTEALEALDKKTLKELKAFLEKYKDAYSKLDTSSKEKLYAGLGEMLKGTADDKAFFENIGRAYSGITQEHKDAFKKKYKKNKEDGLDIERIKKAITDETIPVQDLLVALSLAAETGAIENLNAAKAWIDMAKDFEEDNQKLNEARENLEAISKIRNNSKYTKLFEEFNKNPTDPKAKETLLTKLAKISKEDSEIIKKALEAEVSEYEKRIVLTETFKGTKKTKGEIDKDTVLNFRQAAIALSLIEEKDVAEWLAAKSPKVTAEEAQEMRELIRLRAPKAENEKSPIPDELKGLGLAGLIKLLIEQLTDLFKKISEGLDDTFKKKTPEKQKPKFAKSPFEGNTKFAIKAPYAAGKGVFFDTPKDTKIFAVEKGKLTIDAATSTVTIKKNHSEIIYQGITPKAGLTTGAEINAGDEIGAINDASKLTLQVKDDKGTELNPTELLAPYTAPAAAATAAAAPAAAATAAAAPAAAAPSVAPSAGPKTAQAAAAPDAAGPPAATEAEQQAAAELEEQFQEEIAKSFSGRFDQTINFASQTLKFDAPYKNGAKIDKIPCQIQGSTVTINGTKYEVKLSNNATLQNLSLSGENILDRRKTWASEFSFSDGSKIKLPKFIKALEALRPNNSNDFTYAIPGGPSITFTK